MNFEIEKTDRFAVIKLKVEKLDSNIAPLLKSELVILNSDGVKNIIIDMALSRYSDSSGLSAILVANRLCKNNSGVLVLCNLQEPVKKLIAISQLDTILNITNTLDEAKKLIPIQV